MKVLMLNGSAHQKGCTYTALTEIGKVLEQAGIEVEIFQLGGAPQRDCIGCGACHAGNGCVFKENDLALFVEKAKQADGFIFGTPVYYAHPSARIQAFLDRAFFSCKSAFEFKPGAAVASARRAGTTASIDVLNKYFTIANMPVVPSSYWNMVHGNTPEQVAQDLEGLQVMRNLGHNMAWMLQCFALGRANGIDAPTPESGQVTNFIR